MYRKMFLEMRQEKHESEGEKNEGGIYCPENLNNYEAYN
jgi:hypothetical protein